MKKTITLIALIISFLSFGQRHEGPPPQGFGKNNEKMRAAKISHITNELELTSKEAEKFWPIYNEFDKKNMTLKREIHRTIKNIINNKDGIEGVSEKEAKDILAKLEANKDAINKLEKEYNSDLQTIISAKKILKLHHAEKEFKRKLIHKLRDRKRK